MKWLTSNAPALLLVEPMLDSVSQELSCVGVEMGDMGNDLKVESIFSPDLNVGLILSASSCRIKGSFSWHCILFKENARCCMGGRQCRRTQLPLTSCQSIQAKERERGMGS